VSEVAHHLDVMMRSFLLMQSRSGRWLLPAFLLLAAWSGVSQSHVRAQEGEPSTESTAPTPDDSVSAPADAPPPAAANTSAKQPDPDASDLSLGPVERLPPSAYPEPKTRGLYGGSLWKTFHGLQWPYYPRTGIGVSGYVWFDTGYEHIERGSPTEQSIKYWLQQGRLLLRVTPTYSNGSFFVQGQAELVANKDQSLHQPDIAAADDVWLRAGVWNAFDVQIGRFEGWEVYHLGMGLDINTLERRGATDDVYEAPDIYGVTYGFYRPLGVGQVGVHLYPTDYLRFEVLTLLGNESGSNALGTRPVGILDLGALKFNFGAEYKRLSDQKEGAKGETISRGLGAGLQIILDPYIEFGANGAMALVDRTQSDGTVDEKGSITKYSFGGFANVRIVPDLLLGVGANLTKLHDLHYDQSVNDNGRFDHFQAFVALQYLLLKQLYIKVVGAYAKANFHPTFNEPIFANTMWSGRLRFEFLF
jgi:hypothetical protein